MHSTKPGVNKRIQPKEKSNVKKKETKVVKAEVGNEEKEELKINNDEQKKEQRHR